MAFPTRVFLTGFMGSGKSTIGPMVANVLGYGFADLDDLIEARLGCPIADYFARSGEAAFREVERRVLQETAGLPDYVVALGGGTLARIENLTFALRHGVVVYLRWSAEALADRLRHSTHRPLLQDEHGEPLEYEALEHRIRTMLDAREPFYRQAHIIVDLDGFSVGWSVDEVVKALRQWNRRSRSQRMEDRG